MDPESDQEPVQPLSNDRNCTKEKPLKPRGSSTSSTAQNGLNNNPVTKDGVDAEAPGDQYVHAEEDGDSDGEIYGGKVQANGDIFSPDSSEAVTVICKADVKKAEEHDRADRECCDGYDTHSDSIETLEEESPNDDSQEQLSESLLKQIRLTHKSSEGEDVFEAQTEGAALPPHPTCSHSDGEVAEDSRSTDSHEVIPDTSSPAFSAVSRPESLSLPRPLQYYERNRSTSEPQQGGLNQAQAVRVEASGCHQRTRSEAIDIQNMRARGDLSYGDDIMSRSLPHGTILRKGEMIEFVADDLTEKIKRSSPMSRGEWSCFSSGSALTWCESYKVDFFCASQHYDCEISVTLWVLVDFFCTSQHYEMCQS